VQREREGERERGREGGREGVGEKEREKEREGESRIGVVMESLNNLKKWRERGINTKKKKVFYTKVLYLQKY
jgi:hypothetical protein